MYDPLVRRDVPDAVHPYARRGATTSTSIQPAKRLNTVSKGSSQHQPSATYTHMARNSQAQERRRRLAVQRHSGVAEIAAGLAAPLMSADRVTTRDR